MCTAYCEHYEKFNNNIFVALHFDHFGNMFTEQLLASVVT